MSVRASAFRVLLFSGFLAASAEARELGALVVLSEDSARPVWVSGRYVGHTPVHADSLTPGRYRVSVGPPFSSDPGWTAPWSLLTEVRGARADTLRIPPYTPAERVLAKDSLRVNEAALRDPPDARLVLGGRLGPHRLEKVRVALPIAAVAAGAIGVWARQRGDRAYAEYQTTVDVDRLAAQYDRAQTFDRISSTLWITAEACLVAAAWAWLEPAPRADIAP